MRRERRGSLPLGIEFADRYVRVALAEYDHERGPKLVAVAARAHSGDAETALRDSLAELGTRERRCVLGIAAPDAMLRLASFPAMSRRERARAATFEAARHIDYPIEDAIVSVVELDESTLTLGIARRSVLTARIEAVRRSGLKPIAVDDVGFALQRVFPAWDGAIEVAEESTRVTLFGTPIPAHVHISVGCHHLVEGIARSLGIDAVAAAERLRSIGFAGAGESQRDAFIERLGAEVAAVRNERRPRRLVLVGEAARFPLFPESLERGLDTAVRAAEFEPTVSHRLPPDVLRAAGADWSIAYGLSLWDTAS